MFIMRNSRNGFNVVLSRGRRSNKKITIAVLVLLLTFSIGLAIKSKILKTPTSNQLIPNTKMNMAEKGANDKDDKVSIEWNKTYGGPYWDTSYCVAQTCDGGYILAGSISHGFFGPSDVWLIKVSSDDKNDLFDSDLIFYSIIGVFIGAIALFAIFLSRRRKYELEEV